MDYLKKIAEKGYTTIWDDKIAELVSKLPKNVEFLASTSNTGDVFMCEHGIKQIQNLDNRIPFMMLARMLQDIIEADAVKVLNMQYFIKYPNYKITSPHQDGAYFDKENKTILTFWIPLMDVSPDNSCLFYVPKSHLKGVLPHEGIGTKVRTRTGKTGYSQYCQVYDMEAFEPVPLRAGEIVVHDQFTVHYSSENHTNERRIAVTCIMEIVEIEKKEDKQTENKKQPSKMNITDSTTTAATRDIFEIVEAAKTQGIKGYRINEGEDIWPTLDQRRELRKKGYKLEYGQYETATGEVGFFCMIFFYPPKINAVRTKTISVEIEVAYTSASFKEKEFKKSLTESFNTWGTSGYQIKSLTDIED